MLANELEEPEAGKRRFIRRTSGLPQVIHGVLSEDPDVTSVTEKTVNKHTTRIIAALALLVFLPGCSSTPPETPKTGLQLQAYQASEFSTSKRIAFSATLSVFQDLGFIIDDGDFETGLITATGPTLDTSNTLPDWLSILLSGQSLKTTRHQRATAYVESLPSGSTRNMKLTLNQGGSQ